jgi:hypothetical protein
MTTTLSAPPTPTAPRRRRGPVRRAIAAWPRWTPYAAALWSLAYCALAASWAYGDARTGALRYPFDRAGDAEGEGGLLWHADRDVTAVVLAVLCLAGVAVAGLVARRTLPRPLSHTLVGFAGLAAVALAVLIPDQRVLVALGYAPIVVVGAPWDFPPVSYAEVWPWPVQNQVLLMLGGALWAATAVVAARAGRSGEPGGAGSWTSPESAARWGRRATWTAVVIPLLYAGDRIAWLFGINLGVSDELMNDVRNTDLRYAALGLALGAVGGAILTLGLVQRWGEVFPRWIPVLRGRRVPPALALVPAAVVAMAVTSAGVTVCRMLVTEYDQLPAEDVGAIVPMVLWPFWGVALGAAALAYHLRRRGE